jgi:GNAT superfamily N-acetyltransferase
MRLTKSHPAPIPAEDWAIRKLLASEIPAVRAHMLRLHPDDRRSRFFGGMGDAAVAAYCDALFGAGGIVLGAFTHGVLRGIGELRRQGAASEQSAEVAFSVERAFQGGGIGTELLRRLIEVARNRAIRTVHFHCLMDNLAAQRIVRGAGGALHYADGVLSAEITQSWPSFWSLLSEAISDGEAIWAGWHRGNVQGGDHPLAAAQHKPQA